MKEYAVGKIIGIVPRTTQESPRAAQDGPRTYDDPRETRFPFGPVGPIGEIGDPGEHGCPIGATGAPGFISRERKLAPYCRKMEAARRFVEIARELQLTPADLTDVYTLIEKNTVLGWKD